MSCNSPLELLNPRIRSLYRAHYLRQLDDDELRFELDRTPRYITVPCGKCEGCAESKTIDWCHRLGAEMAYHPYCFFVTLTYDDSFVPCNKYGYNVVCKKDVMLFIRYLRRMEFAPLAQRHSFPVRYFFISEYGPNTQRPHYHGLLFFDVDFTCDDVLNMCESCWKKGFVRVDVVNNNRVNYVARYCNKFFNTPPPFRDPNFLYASQKPAIGLPTDLYDNVDRYDYTINHVIEHGYCPYTIFYDGKYKVVNAPRVYRDKFIKGDFALFALHTSLKKRKSVNDVNREIYGDDVLNVTNMSRNITLNQRFVKSKKSRKL